MIISEAWLRAWVNPKLDTDALAHQLTMAGLEVDAVTPVAGDFTGVVVAEIVSAEQHPDADKLRVCDVSVGEERVQIVCGAPNARAGLKAPLATVGAVLPGNFKIKKAKLRGVESQGMLCAESELELSDEKAGLMELPADAPVGTSLRDYLGLDDVTIEIGLTPNRADCLGIAGIARDVAALNGLEVCEPPVPAVPATIERTFPVTLDAPAQCPRYLGRVIEGVDLTKPTPTDMVERLRRAGVRSIDPVVDVTNYVMLELGQPLHAFDLSTLSGGIVVREAAEGERMTLLDGSDIALHPGTLLIADQERPLAMAGVMGGENSGVNTETRDIFLESAFFAPQPIAGRARSYGLHTDASHRYERGVDWQLQQKAMERATQLLLDIVGGAAGPVVEAVSEEHLPKTVTLTLRAERVARMLGVVLDDARIETILSSLGFELSADGEGQWTVIAPSWRFDMAQEVDLIEEIARVHGYNNIPSTRIQASLELKGRPETSRRLSDVRRALVARGFSEAITYSFIAPDQQALFDPELSPVALRNPISADMSVMRTSLLPGLLAVLSHNLNRQQGRVRVFESGAKFLPGAPATEKPMLALAMTGPRQAEGWVAPSVPCDFYDMKGEVEQLLASVPGIPSFVATQRPGLHDGQTAAVLIDGTEIGVVGALHPEAASTLDLPSATFVAELALEAVTGVRLPSFEEISKYPGTRRDIALLVNRQVAAGDVLAEVRATAGSYLTDLAVFDVYEGEGIDPERKSLALGLTFQDSSRTLDDSDVAAAMSQVIDSLKEKFGAELRS